MRAIQPKSSVRYTGWYTTFFFMGQQYLWDTEIEVFQGTTEQQIWIVNKSSTQQPNPPGFTLSARLHRHRCNRSHASDSKRGEPVAQVFNILVHFWPLANIISGCEGSSAKCRPLPTPSQCGGAVALGNAPTFKDTHAHVCRPGGILFQRNYLTILWPLIERLICGKEEKQT